MDMYELLKKYPLCHRCFGRLYGKLLHTANYERGKSIKLSEGIRLESQLKEICENDNENTDKKEEILKKLNILYSTGLSEVKNIINTTNEKEDNNTNRVKSKCPWCKNIFQSENLEKLSEKILDLIKDYEYDTFLIGTILPKKIKEFENELNTYYPHMESIKQEFNRVMGKIIMEKTNKIPDKVYPDIIIMVNPYKHKIKLQVNPIFIKGRYRKLVRGIPQTKWPCKYCRGKGCEKCNYTGRQYPTSVEDIISAPFMRESKGKDESFHGAGREDIDVRMLGNGRPFVLEIKEPKVRKLDLKKLMEEVNKSGLVEINNLQYGCRKDVVFFKNEPHKKTYEALVECNDSITENELNDLVKKMSNLTIHQRTPLRVSHRRSDLVRIRNVYDCSITDIIDDKHFKLKIYCDGGLYIKELISGDEGRTKPSVSELLGKECICKELDVLEVHDNE